MIPLAQSWGLEGLQGPLRSVVDFVSNMFVLNSLITGQWGVLGDAIRHLILPAVALGTIPLSIIARMTRSSLLDVLGQDYIRTARAKGLSERTVVMRHGFRNSLIPLATIVPLDSEPQSEIRYTSETDGVKLYHRDDVYVMLKPQAGVTSAGSLACVVAP